MASAPARLKASSDSIIAACSSSQPWPKAALSNFLLWQLAYTELYFTDMLWPDFREEALDEAVRSYQCRERRFGRTSEQLAASP